LRQIVPCRGIFYGFKTVILENEPKINFTFFLKKISKGRLRMK